MTSDNLEPEESTPASSEEVSPLDAEVRTAIDASLAKAGISPAGFYRSYGVIERFIDYLISNADHGAHIIKPVFSEHFKALFLKLSEKDVQISTNIAAIGTHLAVQRIAKPQFAVELQTFSQVKISDVIHLDSRNHKEVRGWIFIDGLIVALDGQQLIDLKCTDFSNGKILDPDPNTAYCDAWDVPVFEN